MSQKPNPFLRGYWNLKITRTLCISYEDGSPHVWRNIHPSQQHLSDEELISSSCIVTSDFAVVSNGPDPVSAEVLAECDAGEGVSGQSVIGAVVYSIHGDDFDGRPVHVGDNYSAEAARDVVQRLSFETGYFSRAWEISREHIVVDTWHYLANLADLATPEAFLFIAFRVPYSPAIGVKLISTPWTDHNLEHAEPFETLIRKRQYLPNPVARGCTTSLKIRPMHRFLRHLGWTDWDQMIGIRADEQRRVAKIRARGHSTESTHETMCMPLADTGVTVRDVGTFWQAQPFDLDLLTVNGRTLEGNCDLCFLKPRGQRLALIKARPEAAVWWIRMESLNLASKPSGARFRADGPGYADLARFAADQGDLFDAAEEPIACLCGD